MIDLDGLLAKGCGSKARVGIGGARTSSTASRLAAGDCSVELIAFDTPSGMADALSRGEIDAGVRGTLSSRDTLGELKVAFGLERVQRTAFLGTAGGRAFMLTPVGIDEGRTAEERTDLVRATIEYLRPTGWSPRVGVLSKGRAEDSDRGEDIRASLEEGERIARRLMDDGVEATHHGILVEEAIRLSDLLVAPDGVSGNLMFRSLHFIGSGRAFGAPTVNLPAVFVDTSRAKADYADPVMLAAGLAELGCGRRHKA